MKILLLNTYDGNGGAARAAYRLHLALTHVGVKSNFTVFYKFSQNPIIHAFANSFLNKLRAVYTIFLSRKIQKSITNSKKIPFSVLDYGVDISKHPLVKSADIIHLHWINHGFLSAKSLEKLFALGKPIVFTMHDSFLFTGGCHVRYDCTAYLNSCGNCPALKSPGLNDVSAKQWQLKNTLLSNQTITIISPSKWLQQDAKNSSILQFKEVINIPNAIETDIFKPIDKTQARNKLGLPLDKFLMLSGFAPSAYDGHKGADYLLKALQIFNSKIDDNTAELLIFGNKNNEMELGLTIPTFYSGVINDDEKLALLYAAADVFLVPSLEDNLPNTVMESLACGTPVVAFSTGGIPEMIDHQQNGYLAKYKSVEDFSDGIFWIYNHPSKTELTKAAREKVLTNYTFELVAEKHIQLYKKLLSA